MKRLSKKQKQEQAVIDLINKMFEIAGHNITYHDVVDRTDDWYTKWTMTTAQAEEWIKWGKQYKMKKFRMRARSAELEMEWVNLQWGLKIKI